MHARSRDEVDAATRRRRKVSKLAGIEGGKCDRWRLLARRVNRRSSVDVQRVRAGATSAATLNSPAPGGIIRGEKCERAPRLSEEKTLFRLSSRIRLYGYASAKGPSFA